MKKFLSYILFLIASLVATACSEDIFTPGSRPEEGQPIDLKVCTQFPEMSNSPGTRSFIDNPTVDYIRQLHIHLFVFDEAGVMLQYVRPAAVKLISVNPDTKLVTFKVENLLASSRKRIIHLIASTVDDFTDDNQAGGAENIRAMANENTSMANLTVKDNNNAYWTRVVLDKGISYETNLSLRLLRNFAKITVDYKPVEGASSAHTFELLGFTVANRPNIGTVAPFQFRDQFFAQFFDDNKEPIDYDEIRQTGYIGVNPSGVDDNLLNTTVEEMQADLDRDATEPVYFYERSQSGYLSGSVSDNLTYIIVKGRFDGNINYYRIDIGADYMGRFQFFDILRNFQYSLTITEVGGPGVATVEEAINSPAQNNLSTSVVTKDLFSIGYDNQRIEVSTTTAILVSDQDYQLRFRYIHPDTESGYAEPENLYIYDPEDELDEINMAGCPKEITNLEGNVIKSARVEGPDADGWYTMTISPKDAPTTGYRTQNIRIYYKGANGLGRTVTLQRRKPWNFTDNIRHDGRDYTPGMTEPAVSTLTGGGRKNPVNIYTFLPAGIAESIFPLTFVFESDKQNVYAYPGGSLTVTSLAKSGFTGGTTNRVIAYERRIEWSEYSSASRTGKWIATPFLYNTTLAEDRNYQTARIDRANDTDANANVGRRDNNDTDYFAMRITNPDGYFDDVIDNIRRLDQVTGTIDMAWNTNPAISSTMPATNENPYAMSGSQFTLYYRLPADIPEELFAGGLTVSINSTTDMTLGVSRPDGLTSVNSRNFTQTITYDRYRNNRVIAMPVTLAETGNTFDVKISAPLINTATETVTRRGFGTPDITWTRNTSGIPSSTMPGRNHPYRYSGAQWMLYYKLPDNLPQQLFANGGMEVTLKSTVNMATSGSTPFGLSGSNRSFTQTVTWEEYQRSPVIYAPFSLMARSDSFTIYIGAIGLDTASEGVPRLTMSPTLAWNINTSATPSDFPGENNNTNPSTRKNSPWMLFYQLPNDLPQAFFGDSGVTVTIRATNILGSSYDVSIANVSNKYGLTGSNGTFTRTITYDQYLQSKNDGYVICAPLTLTSRALFSTSFNLSVTIGTLDEVTTTVDRE